MVKLRMSGAGVRIFIFDSFLGIVVMEMLNKGDPYPGMPDQEVALSIRAGEMTPSITSDCPEELSKLLHVKKWETSLIFRTVGHLIHQIDPHSQLYVPDYFIF
jgi:hypothetical protein